MLRNIEINTNDLFMFVRLVAIGNFSFYFPYIVTILTSHIILFFSYLIEQHKRNIVNKIHRLCSNLVLGHKLYKKN